MKRGQAAEMAGRRVGLLVGVAVCLCMGLTVYFRNGQDQSSRDPARRQSWVDFDQFAIDGYAVDIFDGGSRTASVTSNQLVQRKRVHHGFRFESYAEIHAAQLHVDFSTSGDGYHPKSVFMRLMYGTSNQSHQLTPQASLRPVESGTALAQPPPATPLSTENSTQAIAQEAGGGAIWLDLGAAQTPVAAVTRVTASPVTISFALRGGERIVVTAGNLQTHVGNYDFVRLSGQVEFRCPNDVSMLSQEAVWDLRSNTFFVAGAEPNPVGKGGWVAVGGVVACIPDPQAGLGCAAAADYPRVSADPLDQAAVKIRAALYRKLGLCTSSFGKLFCGTG